MKAQVTAICIGQPRPFNGAELSAIGKQPMTGPVMIRTFGIEGDMVADTKHHGGADMAVHHYPGDHYKGWHQWLGGHELLSGPAAFGENLMVLGMTEDAVHIGDRFRFGGALLEISQPRQPCWKIEHHFGRKGMVKRIIGQHNCGWYYRVLEEGEAAPGDILMREEIGQRSWTVARLFAALYDPAHGANREAFEEIAGLDRLCENWRGKAHTKLET